MTPLEMAHDMVRGARGEDDEVAYVARALIESERRLADIRARGCVVAGETLDAVADALGIPKDGVISGETALQALAKAREETLDAPWSDKPDEHTEAITAAFPTRSGSHAEFAQAMQMVGNRQSKAALVALVNWLLVRQRTAREEGATAMREAAVKACSGFPCECGDPCCDVQPIIAEKCAAAIAALPTSKVRATASNFIPMMPTGGAK